MESAALQGDAAVLSASGAQASLTSRRRFARLALILAALAYVGMIAGGWWLALRLVPSHLSVTMFGYTRDIDSAHEHINNIALIFLLLPAALAVEAAVIGWSKSSARQLLFSPTPSLKTDIACFFLGQAHVLDIAGRILALGASMISGAWIHQQLKAATGLDMAALPAPLPVQVVFYFFVYSFFDYWTHRFDHTPVLWPLHRYHHSATDFGVITAGRQHPAVFTAIFVVNLPLAILGAPADAMIYVNVLVVGIGLLIHSKMDAHWGWVGRWLIQSPNHHRLHHKLDMSSPTGHFSIAPVWDRLFGTWYGDKPAPGLAVGVDTPYSHGLMVPRDMARDYAHFWIGLFGGRNDGPDSALWPFRRRR